LELTAICIAGGAGLRVGWAMVDPGDRGRVTALGEEARDAVLLILGAIPAFGVAAVIEGFVTGRTGAPIVEVLIGVIVVTGYLALLLFPTRGRSPDEAPGEQARTVRVGPAI
ncbi:MAG: stage II sporulation protein M, partial [Actinomycetota bacterium]